MGAIEQKIKREENMHILMHSKKANRIRMFNSKKHKIINDLDKGGYRDVSSLKFQ